ncbi:hypothetical protein [Phenylobacterium sp.]|jgi:hypothetical protein|uniref:hypothetical protein n=1 Tax=Phenylobacterium sp. TaxID=1871053 RepID=UPI002F9410CF
MLAGLAAIAVACVAYAPQYPFLNKLCCAARAAFGSEPARGEVHLWAGQNKLARDWAYHRGLTGSPPTLNSALAFLKRQYDVSLEGMGSSEKVLSPTQQRALLLEIARILFRSGLMSVEAAAPAAPREPSEAEVLKRHLDGARDDRREEQRRAERAEQRRQSRAAELGRNLGEYQKRLLTEKSLHMRQCLTENIAKAQAELLTLR